MNEKNCQHCKNYVQHYGLFDGKLKVVYCGHCKANYTKRKHPDDPACPKFVFDQSIKMKMVSKEYLTRKLLQHILEMELWSEDMEQPLVDE